MIPHGWEKLHSDPESKEAEQQKNFINPYCELKQKITKSLLLANEWASRVPPAIDYTLIDTVFSSDELR